MDCITFWVCPCEIGGGDEKGTQSSSHDVDATTEHGVNVIIRLPYSLQGPSLAMP
jgi:hypothetical protein